MNYNEVIKYMISIIHVSVGICMNWQISGEAEWTGYQLNQTRVNAKSLWMIILKEPSRDTDPRPGSKSMLDTLPLFIKVTLMKQIVDEIERMRTMVKS